MPSGNSITELIERHRRVDVNPPRRNMIKDCIQRREAIVLRCGALATWTPPESTGRSPADTVTVCRSSSESEIDWDSPNNIPIEPDTFDMLFEDALETLGRSERLYVVDRVVGADKRWALPVRTVTDRALTALFVDNMFRPVPAAIEESVFYDKPFLLLVCPYHKLDGKRYEGRLRKLPDGSTSDMAVAMDFDRRIGIVYGSAYCGSVKKMIFTVMNYYLPTERILPLHCSATEGRNGDVALLLGLSGTGKTTLSAEPDRALLGDDEHGWSDNGVANFENGCYAKLINLDPVKEPEIYKATFHEDEPEHHGVIVENAMVYPDGSFDLDDDRLTPNSRSSYPLSYLTNVKDPPVAGHPKTILFLTADANGVLPPLAVLTQSQAMLWFVMGYTSKLAGTETGVVEPVSVFSRFFGQPFMPRNPDVYAHMLGEKLDRHETRAYLINTGWTGGPYGTGRRIDLDVTRAMVRAALDGSLVGVPTEPDPYFKVNVPRMCPGLDDSEILRPENSWSSKTAYEQRARRLAAQFAEHFRKAFGEKGLEPEIREQCPGL